MIEKQIAEGGLLQYDDKFLPEDYATKLFRYLTDNVSWEKKMYTDYRTGNQYPQPRLTAWYADDPNMEYSYSGITQKVQPWNDKLAELRDLICKVSGVEYNSVLLNLYRDGKDSVGSHADDERELGTNANIASVSLGATRKFILSQYKRSNKKIVDEFGYEEYELVNGSLLIMSGTTQHYWKHSIPKDSSVTESRINLTFRKFYK